MPSENLRGEPRFGESLNVRFRKRDVGDGLRKNEKAEGNPYAPTLDFLEKLSGQIKPLLDESKSG